MRPDRDDVSGPRRPPLGATALPTPGTHEKKCMMMGARTKLHMTPDVMTMGCTRPKASPCDIPKAPRKAHNTSCPLARPNSRTNVSMAAIMDQASAHAMELSQPPSEDIVVRAPPRVTQQPMHRQHRVQGEQQIASKQGKHHLGSPAGGRSTPQQADDDAPSSSDACRW